MRLAVPWVATSIDLEGHPADAIGNVVVPVVVVPVVPVPVVPVVVVPVPVVVVPVPVVVVPVVVVPVPVVVVPVPVVPVPVVVVPVPVVVVPASQPTHDRLTGASVRSSIRAVFGCRHRPREQHRRHPP